MSEFDLEIDEDPELDDSKSEPTCDGGEEHYDQLAVETIPFEASQFELPDDFEVEDDGGDNEDD